MDTLRLHSHPFASYCQKVLIALYENATPFQAELVEGEAALARLAALWPLKHLPVLVDGETVLPEATTIIEHLDVHHAGPLRWLPADPAAAIEVRLMDRVFDNHVQTPMQKIVGDTLRPAHARDAHGVNEAHAALETIYAWLDRRLAGRAWAAGDAFGLADCAGGPALFYADWVHAIDARHANLRAYRTRINARPSFARVIDEARPYRRLFPLGAPNRD